MLHVVIGSQNVFFIEPRVLLTLPHREKDKETINLTLICTVAFYATRLHFCH